VSMYPRQPSSSPTVTSESTMPVRKVAKTTYRANSAKGEARSPGNRPSAATGSNPASPNAQANP
jgi:hypothetical protein